jgi:hypothetical protein
MSILPLIQPPISVKFDGARFDRWIPGNVIVFAGFGVLEARLQSSVQFPGT